MNVHLQNQPHRSQVVLARSGVSMRLGARNSHEQQKRTFSVVMSSHAGLDISMSRESRASQHRCSGTARPITPKCNRDAPEFLPSFRSNLVIINLDLAQLKLASAY